MNAFNLETGRRRQQQQSRKSNISLSRRPYPKVIANTGSTVATTNMNESSDVKKEEQGDGTGGEKGEDQETDTIIQLQLDSSSSSSTSTTTTTVPFYRSKHLMYIKNLSRKLDRPDSYEGAVTEHLRMSGIYWTYAALSLLVETPEEADDVLGVTKANNDHKTSIIDWVLQCYDTKSGGFGGNINHDGHLLYTLSALQILIMAGYDIHDSNLALPVDDIVQFVSKLQQPDGSFAGDEWGEIDTRFSYCALSAMSILIGQNEMTKFVDVPKAVQYIASCQNLDGGFGSCKGAESHAAQVFCCVGALSIAKSLHVLQRPDLLGWWLAERQVDSGGLNGRPEKQADVCYSWWILSVLKIIGRVDWISQNKLVTFIAKAQDPDDGGIADRPDDMPDIFHTFFGIAGLSLLDKLPDSYRKIDPVYAMPVDVIERCGLESQVIDS
jgi:geranylgeranyl transferase type-2 subunit beta